MACHMTFTPGSTNERSTSLRRPFIHAIEGHHPRLGSLLLQGGKAHKKGRCTPPAVDLAPTVAQELARQRPCRLSVLEGHLTVHHDPIVTLGFLDPSPLTTRQVLGNLGGRA